MLAALFIQSYRDPVRYKWIITFGLTACGGMIAGCVCGIPLPWRFIDCSFGVHRGYSSRPWLTTLSLHLYEMKNLNDSASWLVVVSRVLVRRKVLGGLNGQPSAKRPTQIRALSVGTVKGFVDMLQLISPDQVG